MHARFLPIEAELPLPSHVLASVDFFFAQHCAHCSKQVDVHGWRAEMVFAFYVLLSAIPFRFGSLVLTGRNVTWPPNTAPGLDVEVIDSRVDNVCFGNAALQHNSEQQMSGLAQRCRLCGSFSALRSHI